MKEMEHENDMDVYLQKFSSKDFIMETSIFSTLKKYFQIGGEPEKVVQLLSDNYTGTAQMANIISEWLILAGMESSTLHVLIEEQLKDMITKQFDPVVADGIFLQEEINVLSWLPEMISHATWRSLIYNLSEKYPDCVFLNFAIKLISDAGYQSEITSVATASQQIEIFSKVLESFVISILEAIDETHLLSKIRELTKLACHGEHTYLYSISLFKYLSQQYNLHLIFKRIIQEIQVYATSHNLDSCPIDMAIDRVSRYPKLFSALSSMLSKKALNPADITLIYKLYTTGPDLPPPPGLLRNALLIDLLVDALFKPMSIVNPDHRPKYIYILAYASSVYEDNVRGGGEVNEIILRKDELKALIQAIEKTITVCAGNSNSSDTLCDLPTLFSLIRYPVIALGIFTWLSHILQESSYFINRSDNWNGFHLTLIDEIASCHSHLHDRILKVLIKLFSSPFQDLEVLIQLGLKKVILERMVHLFSRGYVLPVLEFICDCVNKQDTDVSLLRHFVQEILEMISPPYHTKFVEAFLPVLNNKDITGSLIAEDKSDAVSQFLVHCETHVHITTSKI